MNKAEELAVAEALNQLREPKSGKPSSRSKPAGQSKGKPTARSASQKHSNGSATTKGESHSPESDSGLPEASDQTSGVPVSNLRLSDDSNDPMEETPPPSNAGSGANGTAFGQIEASSANTTPPPPPEGQEESQQQPWRSYLLTATSLVLTKDARKKIRQVLSLLRLASEHLNTKVNALKQAMESDADNDNVKPKISKVAIRNDIIMTIKKCLTMLSTLATSSLPAAACGRVRCTLLRLPSRWAQQLGTETVFETDGKSESAVLALATETLISIQNITNILSESMDRADSWVERLPSFGYKRRRDDEVDAELQLPNSAEAAEPAQKPASPRKSGDSFSSGSLLLSQSPPPYGEPDTKAIKIG